MIYYTASFCHPGYDDDFPQYGWYSYHVTLPFILFSCHTTYHEMEVEFKVEKQFHHCHGPVQKGENVNIQWQISHSSQKDSSYTPFGDTVHPKMQLKGPV